MEYDVSRVHFLWGRVGFGVAATDVILGGGGLTVRVQGGGECRIDVVRMSGWNPELFLASIRGACL